MSKLVAIGDNVIGREIIETESKGGIIIPETAAPTTPQLECEVVSVGAAVSASLKVGDTIYCHQQGGQALMRDGVLYRVLKLGEIYGREERDGE